MNPLSDSDLRSLGLSGVLRGTATTHLPPAQPVGRGLSRGELSDAELRSRFEASPGRTDETLDALEKVAPRSILGRWSADPRVLLIELPREGVSATWRGPAVELSGDPVALIVQPGRGRFAMVVQSQQGAVLLAIEGGAVLLTEVDLRSNDLERLGVVHVHEPKLAPVDWKTLALSAVVEPWLETDVQSLLASPRDLDHLAGAGMLARLWLPPKSTDMLSRMKQVVEGPIARAESWLRSCAEAARIDAEDRAFDEIEVLREGLLELEEAAIAQADGRATLGHFWVDDRDDLESVRFMLRRIGEGSLLHGALQDFDSFCATRHTLWSMIPLVPSKRLVAVGNQEPDVWWGALAVPRR